MCTECMRIFPARAFTSLANSALYSLYDSKKTSAEATPAAESSPAASSVKNRENSEAVDIPVTILKFRLYKTQISVVPFIQHLHGVALCLQKHVKGVP